ncbi:hypothetical protein [Arthrobacter sp. NA-172]|uniref:hypothetical protein n=1 Tax=Arthrobacter sp. NA-172 TaxID=3367524 RepID=UPI003754BAA0
MPTSAVAIIELLIGFSVDPSSNGAVNLQPSGFEARFSLLKPGTPVTLVGGAGDKVLPSTDGLDGRAASGAVTAGWL